MRGLLIAGALCLLPGCESARTSSPAVRPVAAAPLASADRAATPRAGDTSVDTFAAQVRPILEARCQPCHFPGGKKYQDLPFDRAETIRALGERLFTRIKDPAEQAKIRAFLAGKPNA